MSAVHPGSLPLGTERVTLAGGLVALSTRPPGGTPVGATVVLVPGYTGSKEDFQLLLGPLSRAGHPAVALDQRGQFESAGSGDADSYSVSSLAADLRRAVDGLGAGPIHLVGHSFGGLVARAAVIADPGWARSLVLMGSGPAALGGSRRDGLEYFVPLLREHGLARAAEIVEAAQAADPHRVAPPPDVAAFLRHRLMSSDPAALTGMARALLDEPDRTDELAAAGLPLLVLHGENEDAWPPPVQTGMARRLGVSPVVIAGAAHSPAAERPEATARALLAFFRSAALTG